MEANSTWLIVFVGLTCAAVLLQAGVLLGIFLSVRKTAEAVNVITKEMKTTVIPLVDSTRELLERVSPQIQTVTQGLADLTEAVHNETKGARVSIAAITDRVNTQAKRLDHMLTVALDTVEKAAGAIEHSVAAPVRQVNGVVAALKAVVGTYRSTRPASRAANGRASYPVPDPDRDIVL